MLTTTRERWRDLLLEGIAVLLGVLLAFAVDSYGKRLSERKAERAYLIAFADELQTNQELLTNLSAETQSRIDEVKHFLTNVVHTSTTDPARVNEMLTRVGPFRVVAFQRGALDDLLTSGGIELVRSNNIRRGVLSYAQLLEQEMVRQEAALRFWEDHMAPYYYQHASFFDFMSWIDVDGESLPDALNVEAFHRSHRYSNLLFERTVRDRSLLDTRAALNTKMNTLAALLPAETAPHKE